MQAKKLAKKSNKGKRAEGEQLLASVYAEEEEKMLGPKPTCYDTLPFQLFRGSKAVILALPGAYGSR